MPKRKCSFNVSLKEQFPFIKHSHIQSDKVKCSLCHAVFSVAHGGRTDILGHVGTKKHKSAVSAKSSSQPLTSFFGKKEFCTMERELAAQEATLAYHAVRHNHSFQSMDCTTHIVKKLFNRKFTCAQTKCKAIIANVLAPYAKNQLLKELNNAKFICISVDSSNHIDLKIVPVIVRYFSPDKGIQIKILEFASLPGETSDLLTEHIFTCVEKYNLADKIVGISADNTNTNFRGARRKGKNNVFTKVQEKLKRKIIGVGCAAHIIHNSVQTAADSFPVDIQSILGKVYQYFHQYTVRVESLRSFCDFAEIQYKTILGHSKTRWLSLLPALNRFIEMYDGLKSYFLSLDKCPTVLREFFNNKYPFIFFVFMKTQLKMFSDAIERIEREEATGFEVKKEIDFLINKLIMRRNEQFLHSDVKEVLNELHEENLTTPEVFKNYVADFYDTAVQYIEEWSQPFCTFAAMEWVSLSTPFCWEDVSKCIDGVRVVMPNFSIEEGDLIDEFTNVKLYAEGRIDDWNKNGCKVDDRWIEVFLRFNSEHISYKHMELLVGFCMALPGSNASVERIFSLMTSLWTYERNSLQLDTVKSLLIIKTHFKQVTCSEFFDLICKDTKLLEQIHAL